MLEFIRDHEVVYIVELNRDGQLAQLLTIHSPDQAQKFRNVTKVDGLPLTAKWIAREIQKFEEK